MTTQKRNPELVELLRPEFQGRNEPQFAWTKAVSAHLMIPGLRAFWPMSSVDENGDAYDVSGQGRVLYRDGSTYSVNPGGAVTSNVMQQHAQFNGTGALYRPMEPGLAPTGNETFVNAAWRGVTMGAWVWFNNVIAVRERIMVNGSGAAGNFSYIMDRNSTGELRAVFSNGAALAIATSGAVKIADGLWYHTVARYDYDTEVSAWLDGVEYTNAAAGFGNLNTALGVYDFSLGADRTVAGVLNTQMTGRIALAWLSNWAVPDTTILSIYHQTKHLFGK